VGVLWGGGGGVGVFFFFFGVLVVALGWGGGGWVLWVFCGFWGVFCGFFLGFFFGWGWGGLVCVSFHSEVSLLPGRPSDGTKLSTEDF